MFTSDTKKNRDRYWKTITVYLGVTLFCVLFGAVYEVFSHGVYSYPMLYAFAFPLVCGVTPFFLLFKYKRAYPSSFSAGSYHAGVATCTVGSIMTGVLEIYGTSSPLLSGYWIIGIGLVAVGVLSYLFLVLLIGGAKENQAA